MTAVIGFAAVFSAVLIFCGSVWMLLTLVIGSRLAYFVTASITFAFIAIMGAVWSYGTQPLGPVAKQPQWLPTAIGASPADVNFGPAAQFPNAPWFVADTTDAAKSAQASALQSAASNYLQAQIDAGKIKTYSASSDATVSTDSTHLIDQNGTEYGALQLEPAAGKKGTKLFVVMQYDPGNPFLYARFIAAGALLLFALHLFGLSRAEGAARRRAEAMA
jgi:ABC-type transport system involved in multi-copper enzyme maturation permease subunit